MRPCGVSQWCHGYGPASNKAQGSARITSSLLRNALAKAAIEAGPHRSHPDKARLIERSPEEIAARLNQPSADGCALAHPQKRQPPECPRLSTTCVFPDRRGGMTVLTAEARSGSNRLSAIVCMFHVKSLIERL
jgi:hypothetical protein